MKIYLRMAALLLSVLMLWVAVGCTEEPIEGSSSYASSDILTSQQTITSSDVLSDIPDGDETSSAPPAGNTSSATTSGKPKPKPTPTPTPTPAPAPKPTTPGVVTIAGWWDLLPSADAATEKNRLQYFQLQQVMQDYNVNVEVIVVDKREIVPNVNAAYISGNHWADVVNMSYADAYAMAKKGRLMDITGLYDHDSFDYNQSIRKLMTIDGKIYGFSQYESEMESSIAFNKDIFDRQGLAYPYDLVKNKQWTWDKFVEYVEDATIWTPAGTVETYGWYAKADLDTTSALMYAAIGRQFVEVNSSGKYLNKASNSDVKSFLERVRALNLMEEVYLPAAHIVTWADAPVKFKAGKVAMMPCTTAGLSSALGDMYDDWGVVPMPTLSEGGEYKQLYLNHNTVIVMPHLDKEWAKDVAMVYSQVFKNPYTEQEYEDVRRADLEGRFRDMESIEMVLQHTGNASGRYNYIDILEAVTNGDISYKVENDLTKALRGEAEIEATLSNIYKDIGKVCSQANK